MALTVSDTDSCSPYHSDRTGNGKVIGSNECTTLFDDRCASTYSNRTKSRFTIHAAGVFWGQCVYCDVWGDTASLPSLERGDSGSYVRYLQGKLNTQRKLALAKYNLNGFDSYLDVDGSFGAGVENAVRIFQKLELIDIDGHVGPTTWSHLLSTRIVYDNTKRPNCASYSTYLSDGQYRERCTCYTWRNAKSTSSSSYCEATCDLQGCVYCYGSSYSAPPEPVNSPCSQCDTTTYTPAPTIVPVCSCDKACYTSGYSCNPNANVNCAVACYGHTSYCPTNIDYKYRTVTKLGDPNYKPCAICNAAGYGAVACASCDKVQYDVNCRQCNQAAYYIDDYYEDYM